MSPLGVRFHVCVHVVHPGVPVLVYLCWEPVLVYLFLQDVAQPGFLYSLLCELLHLGGQLHDLQLQALLLKGRHCTEYQVVGRDEDNFKRET